MQWMLRHWTTMSRRRTLLALMISLSVTWIVALGCIEGIARRDGVFLRTAKAGSRRSILRALRLTRIETGLAVALYIGTGFLLTLPNRPWLLAFFLFFQGTVYLCSPIASVWSLWAQGVPSQELRHRFEERRLRAARRRRSWAQLPKRTAAALAAVCVGGVTSAFFAPVPLLHTTAVDRRAAVSRSLTAGTEVYLQLGSSTAAATAQYYRITLVHFSTTPTTVGLRFTTSSLVLLGDVLQAGAGSGRLQHVSLAIREPGASGRPVTDLVETFATAVVGSFDEHLSGKPVGTVSLVLPTVSRLANTPAELPTVTQFADLASTKVGPATAMAYLHLAAAGGDHQVTAVELSQARPRAPVTLRFATSSLPLLDAIFHSQSGPVGITSLRLLVRPVGGGQALGTSLSDTFSRVGIGSVAETLSGSIFGTATLVVTPG
jgi:hypothetical protein